MSNELETKGETVLLQEALNKFYTQFGRLPIRPTFAVCAPGRVNLIGDHIDYCGGFVLPAALPFVTLIVGSLNDFTSYNIVSLLTTGKEVKVSIEVPTSLRPIKPGPPAWSNYIKGVISNFPVRVPGFDAVIVSDVPMGYGLSSSAAVEVATFTLLEELTGHKVGLVEKAKLCQKAENEFPGMPCGIMDQYIAIMGKKDHALLIDCRSLEAEQIPMDLGDLTVLVTNSNVKHQLTGSEYPTRRAQCQEAADRLGLPSLREANIEDLEKLKAQNCEEVVLMRARHVIEETRRTVEVAEALKKKDFKKVGEILYQSHHTLSKLMEVSCPELDQIVDIVRDAPGVLGARMTGGGFAGCVVTLVQKREVENLKKRILSQYQGTPTFFLCQPSDGARVLQLK